MTDNGLAALAERLPCPDANRDEPDEGCGHGLYEECAAAIIGERGVFLPDGLPQPPEGTRLILAASDLLGQFGTRTDDGRTIAGSWGEPNENGWYTPTFTSHAPAIITEQAATIATLRAALEDAGYLADSAKHLTDHLASEHPDWYCEDMDTTQHFAAKVRAALAAAKEAGG
jgi:hypothetical protein